MKNFDQKTPDFLKALLDNIPAKPGCYMMKNKKGKIIYIGKAVNLRSRVRSYFHASAQNHIKTRHMVRKIADIEWIVVGSELEALILEMNLIKKHRPHYNVRLKDDKRYPYIKVHWSSPFPKVTVTRIMQNDGSRYFGPYTSVWAVHQTLDVLRRIFPYLTCDRVITGQDERACLYYDIKLCSGPCIGSVDKAQYRQMIDDLCSFLNGRTEPIVTRLQTEMEQAAEDLYFERAAALRDQIKAIETVVERQKVVSTEYIDSDVVAMARDDKEACVQVFFIRGGKMIGREYFLLDGADDLPDSEVMADFLQQFYDQAPNVPPKVLLPHDIEEFNIIRQWLSTKRGGEKVELLIPHEGQQQDLIQMAAENAADTLAALKAQWESDRHRQTTALAEIQEVLGMSAPPTRVECYDISNTQGTAAVGSMVVFEQGVPNKKKYRRFNIRTVSGVDDFASMEEVLTRRFRRWQIAQETKTSPGKKHDQAFGQLPDLLIVDGGKGQLSRAISVLERFNLTDEITVVGLAKQHEEIFIPNRKNAVRLERKSQGLFLIQRIRDEAHRFAITAHRKRRAKLGLTSRLEAIPGIGPIRRKTLLNHFGTVDNIKKATLKDLTEVSGISEKVAQNIKSHLS